MGGLTNLDENVKVCLPHLPSHDEGIPLERDICWACIRSDRVKRKVCVCVLCGSLYSYPNNLKLGEEMVKGNADVCFLKRFPNVGDVLWDVCLDCEMARLG